MDHQGKRPVQNPEANRRIARVVHSTFMMGAPGPTGTGSSRCADSSVVTTFPVLASRETALRPGQDLSHPWSDQAGVDAGQEDRDA